MPLDLPPSNDIQLEVNNVDILEEYRARATSFEERITKMFGDDTEKWPESIRLMYYEPKEGVHRMFQAYNEAIKEFDRIENELGQVENGASQIHQTIGELKVRIAELSDPEAELENNDDYKNGQIAYAQEVRKKLEIELEDADLLAMLKSQNKDIVHEQSLRRAKDTLQKEVTELETKLGGADKLSDNLKDQEKAVEEVLSVVQGSIDRFFLKAEMEKSALEKMKAADEQYTTLRLQTELEQIDRGGQYDWFKKKGHEHAAEMTLDLIGAGESLSIKEIERVNTEGSGGFLETLIGVDASDIGSKIQDLNKRAAEKVIRESIEQAVEAGDIPHNDWLIGKGVDILLKKYYPEGEKKRDSENLIAAIEEKFGDEEWDSWYDQYVPTLGFDTIAGLLDVYNDSQRRSRSALIDRTNEIQAATLDEGSLVVMFDGRTHSFKTPLDKHIWLHEMAFKMKQAIDEDVKMTGKEMLRYALHKIAQVATSPGGNIIEFPAEIMMLDAKYNDWLYELPSQPTHWYLIFFVLMRAVRMWYTYNRFTTVREQRAEHHRIQKEIEKIQADESMNEQRKQEKIKELQAKDPTYVKRLLESTGLMNDKGQFIINIDSLKNLTSRIKGLKFWEQGKIIIAGGMTLTTRLFLFPEIILYNVIGDGLTSIPPVERFLRGQYEQFYEKLDKKKADAIHNGALEYLQEKSPWKDTPEQLGFRLKKLKELNPNVAGLKYMAQVAQVCQAPMTKINEESQVFDFMLKGRMQYRIDNINAFIDRITPIHKEITPKDWQEYEEFKKIMMKFSSLPGVQQDIPGITNILNARWAVVQSGQPENTSLEMLRNEIFSSLFPVDDAKIQPIKEALIQHVRNAGAVVDWTPESAPAHDQRTAAQHLITAVEEYNGSNWKGLLETLHLEIVNMNWAMSDEMQMEYSYSLTELGNDLRAIYMCSYPTNEEIQKGSYKMTPEERWKAFQAKSLLHTKKYTSRTEAAKKGSPEKVSNELNEADVLILSQGWESMSEAQKDQFLGTLRTLFYKTKEKIPKGLDPKVQKLLESMSITQKKSGDREIRIAFVLSHMMKEYFPTVTEHIHSLQGSDEDQVSINDLVNNCGVTVTQAEILITQHIVGTTDPALTKKQRRGEQSIPPDQKFEIHGTVLNDLDTFMPADQNRRVEVIWTRETQQNRADILFETYRLAHGNPVSGPYSGHVESFLVNTGAIAANSTDTITAQQTADRAGELSILLTALEAKNIRGVLDHIHQRRILSVSVQDLVDLGLDRATATLMLINNLTYQGDSGDNATFSDQQLQDPSTIDQNEKHTVDTVRLYETLWGSADQERPWMLEDIREDEQSLQTDIQVIGGILDVDNSERSRLQADIISVYLYIYECQDEQDLLNTIEGVSSMARAMEESSPGLGAFHSELMMVRERRGDNTGDMFYGSDGTLYFRDQNTPLWSPPSETNEDENMDANEEFTIDWEAQIDIEINDDNRNDPSTYTPLLLRQKMYEDLIQENGGDNDVRATRFVEARDALVNLMSQTTGTNFDLDKTLDGIGEAYGGLEAVGINYNARTGNLRVGTLVRGKK